MEPDRPEGTAPLPPVDEPAEEGSGEGLLPVDAPDSAILSQPGMAVYRANFTVTTFPATILGDSLQIVWRNESFREVFAWPAIAGETLLSALRATMTEEEKGEIYRCLKDDREGFSWRGRIQAGGGRYRRVQANVLISPILENRGPAETRLQGYLVTVDDVTKETRDLVRGTFTSLLEASRLKDNDTGKHVGRVNEYCRELAGVLLAGGYDDVDAEYVDTISFVAAMHDVGKIGTPDDILNKQGPLTDWEWGIMKEHTKNGAYILASYPHPMAREIALLHHERWDGNGYPFGLAGDMIPLSARIVSLADAYDALRMQRSYKPAYSHDEAYAEIERSKSRHFDPHLADLFLEHHRKMEQIYAELTDYDEPSKGRSGNREQATQPG